MTTVKRYPKPARRVNAVCSECADRHGGIWPPGHCATVEPGTCDACDHEAVTCSVDDWDWPSGKPRGWRGVGRD